MNLLFATVILAPFVFLAELGIVQLWFPKIGLRSLTIQQDTDMPIAQREAGFTIVFLFQAIAFLFAYMQI